MIPDYEERMRREIDHYGRVLQGRMSQEVPLIWNEVEKRFADAMETVTGVRNLYEYVARHVKGRTHVTLLGLGSGSCGNELDGIAPLLSQESCEMDLVCIDINETLLKQASVEASKRAIRFRGVVQDINKLTLETGRYDVVVAYASLHHFIQLDHIARQIARGLHSDGIFVTVDVPSRNGYRMWDETLEVVNAIWKVLPSRFKIAHTGYPKPTEVNEYENIDYSLGSFECINSEAILPALRMHLREIHFCPAFCIGRRFFDTKFGPNYDLSRPLDRAIFEFVMALDSYYLSSGLLKPETFFGAYGKV